MSNPADRWRPTWLVAVAVLTIVLAVLLGYCASDADETGGPAGAPTATIAP